MRPEIEITEAMLEAGASEASRCLGPSDLAPSVSEADLAKRVFLAMWSLRKPGDASQWPMSACGEPPRVSGTEI